MNEAVIASNGRHFVLTSRGVESGAALGDDIETLLLTSNDVEVQMSCWDAMQVSMTLVTWRVTDLLHMCFNLKQSVRVAAVRAEANADVCCAVVSYHPAFAGLC